jgi:hypothetical protein
MSPLVGSIVGVSIRTGASSTSMRDGALAPPVIVSSLSIVRVSSPSRQRPSSSWNPSHLHLCATARVSSSHHVYARWRIYVLLDIVSSTFMPNGVRASTLCPALATSRLPFLNGWAVHLTSPHWALIVRSNTVSIYGRRHTYKNTRA